MPLRKLLSWSTWEASEQQDKFDDEDPGMNIRAELTGLGFMFSNLDVVPGVAPEWLDDLEMPRRRDPDALPPNNVFEAIMNYTYKGMVAMRGGNTLFAIKAATLTGKTIMIPLMIK